MRALVPWLVGLAVVGALLISGYAPSETAADNEIEADTVERIVYEQQNDVRENASVGEVERSDELDAAAAYWAREQIRRNISAHADSGERLLNRANCSNSGEIIYDIPLREEFRNWHTGEYATVDSSEDAAEVLIAGWLSSPAHRGGMEAERWTHVGVGVAITDDRERLYAVVDYCQY